MISFQDFMAASDKIKFIVTAIEEHRKSAAYMTAVDAEKYDRQLNTTINEVTRKIYTQAGLAIEDPTSSNNKIASNFFHRLNTDRVSYLLGNGVMFTDHITKTENPDGSITVHDETKEAFGDDFDTTLYDIVYSGEISGSSYAYIVDTGNRQYKIALFKLTEFVPLLDEYDGSLRAGIRFWSLDWGKKPVNVVLYEEDGITEYRTKKGETGLRLEVYIDKHSYNQITKTTAARGVEVIGGENPFSRLPIIPYYAAYRQSTLVGLKSAIDAYDLVQSGFANDLQDCAQIYWLIGGALGTTDAEVKKFREKLLFQHIGVIDHENTEVKPYVQEVPHEARKVFLETLRANIYEAFGGFDLRQLVSGDRTATEIQANYTALDEETDAFETRVTRTIRQILDLVGIQDVPQYKRNRIANQLEQTQMIAMISDRLPLRTVLEKLPWITVDEVDTILKEKSGETDNMQSRAVKDVNDVGGEAL